MSPFAVRRVVERATELLKSKQSLLPGKLEVDGELAGGSVLVRFRPERSTAWMHQCQGVFQEICEALNAEFENDRGFMGIELEVPLEFLGDLGIEMSFRQPADGTLPRLRRMGQA
jgi:hypothetical protein